jgi:hypothetical protein
MNIFFKVKNRFVGIVLGAACVLVFLAGCWAKMDYVKAFEGKYSVQENNKLINEYCQTCHVHREFDPGPHVEKMQALYKKKPYRLAGECRVCHFIVSRVAKNEFFRGTRHPDEVVRGKFKDFEKSYSPSQ